MMHCSSVLKPNSAFYSLQGLLSGPVAIATLWQDIAGIRRNGSPDAVHSAPVEELHSPEETKGTLVPAAPFANQRISAKIGLRWRENEDMVPGLCYQGQLSYSWEGKVIGGICHKNSLVSM